MSLRVNTNMPAINSHRNLIINNTEQAKTMERLSSGLKINRGADGPAYLNRGGRHPLGQPGGDHRSPSGRGLSRRKHSHRGGHRIRGRPNSRHDPYRGQRIGGQLRRGHHREIRGGNRILFVPQVLRFIAWPS